MAAVMNIFQTQWYQSHLIKHSSQKIEILPLVLLGQWSYPALNVSTSETLQAKELLIKRGKLNEARSYYSMARRACAHTVMGFTELGSY